MAEETRVRFFKETDTPAVQAIFNHYATRTMAAYFDQAMPAGFIARIREAVGRLPFLVVEEDGRVLGFATARPFHPAPAFDQTVEVSYFLDPEATGRGLGSFLLLGLEKALKQEGVAHMVASVSSANLGSQRFHEARGFSAGGRLKGIGHKQGRDFDVVLYQKRLD